MTLADVLVLKNIVVFIKIKYSRFKELKVI